MDNGYDEIRMAVSEYVYANLEDFQYYKLGDTCSMDKVSEEYKFISSIKENMESSMEINMGDIIDKGYIPDLPTDEKIVLASMVLGAEKYESYEYSEPYRLNKIASLTKSDNAELVRDYIDFSLEYIAYLDDILESELDMEIKTQLNQVTEAYRQRASLGFKKFIDFVVPYRLINK